MRITRCEAHTFRSGRVCGFPGRALMCSFFCCFSTLCAGQTVEKDKLVSSLRARIRTLEADLVSAKLSHLKTENSAVLADVRSLLVDRGDGASSQVLADSPGKSSVSSLGSARNKLAQSQFGITSPVLLGTNQVGDEAGYTPPSADSFGGLSPVERKPSPAVTETTTSSPLLSASSASKSFFPGAGRPLNGKSGALVPPLYAGVFHTS